MPALPNNLAYFFQSAPMFMLVWRGRPRPRALMSGLAVIVFPKFDVFRSMLVTVLMFMIVSMFLRATLLFAEHLARQFFFPVHKDIHLGRGDAAAIDPRNFQPRSDVQRRDRILEELGRHSRIDQRAEEHVAAHAGKAVEVGNAHRKTVVGRWPLVVGLLDDCATGAYEPLMANDQRPTTNDSFHHRERAIGVKPRAVLCSLLQSLFSSTA